MSLKAIAIFDIDGVVRDVSNSYRRAIADTVEHFTAGALRPSLEAIDTLKAEGIWNNDWEASRELVYRYFESQGQSRSNLTLDYDELVEFFEGKYLGTAPDQFTGYICEEPVLMSLMYLNFLTFAGIGWGFFSGAPQNSARYVLEDGVGLDFSGHRRAKPVLVAMEDAPSKPDPTGLLAAVQQVEQAWGDSNSSEAPPPVFYLGDTVADMYTVANARQQDPSRRWIGIGVLPPHLHDDAEAALIAMDRLEQAGAELIVSELEEEFGPEEAFELLAECPE